MENILSKARQTIDDFKLLESGDKILVALSGGPDSVALLYLLNLLKSEYGITLAAVHLDHGLRAQSAADREFCVKLCRALKISLFSKKSDIASLAKRKRLSVEEAGRSARYAYFEFLTQKYAYTKIATGHTLDDNAETVLLNMTRGSGLTGLAGIPHKRDNIIRPLLRLEKAELLRWLRAEKIPFVKDNTNRSLKYARNRIRHNVIPELARINPAVGRNIARMSDIVKEELEYLRTLTVSAYKAALINAGKGKIVLDLGKLVQYDKSLRKKVLEMAVGGLGRTGGGLTSENLFRALDVIDGKSGGTAPLGQGIYIEKSQGRIALLKSQVMPAEIAIQVPGSIKLSSGEVLKAKILARAGLQSLDRGKDAAYLALGKLKDLRIRYWHQGDDIRPLGMRGRRLLSDIFIDMKIPEFERRNIPLVLSGDKIAWIAGIVISDEFKITENTKEILSLEICKP